MFLVISTKAYLSLQSKVLLCKPIGFIPWISKIVDMKQSKKSIRLHIISVSFLVHYKYNTFVLSMLYTA